MSVVSFWEIATLVSLNRLSLVPDLATWLAKVREGGFAVLPIEAAHLVRYAALPQVKDHRDPFDRLLIAQALTDDLILISRDGKFRDYAGLKSQWN